METQNEKTVIGVFDDYPAAERAAQELANAGISRSAIDVRSNFMTGAAGRSVDTEHMDTEPREHGGISGFFRRLFGGDSEEEYGGHYAEAVRRGNAVVCVTVDSNQADRVVNILNSAGAVDIDRQAAQYRETGYERHDPNAPPYSYDEAVAERDRFRGTNGDAVPVVDEELQIGKRTVQRGGVRVHSRVVEEPVEEEVDLREEHVRVERRPADRPIGSRDALRDQTIEVMETVEEPVVQKRARVREEVVINKETKTRAEKVRDTVRRTEVNVERIGGADSVDEYRSDWESRYGTSGEPYEYYEPAYEYGSRSASDSRWAGQSWSDVEEDIRTDYMRTNPNSSWDRMKGAVRYGWEKATGKR